MRHKTYLTLLIILAFMCSINGGPQQNHSQQTDADTIESLSEKSLSEKISDIQSLLESEEESPDQTTRFSWWQKLLLLALGGAATGYIYQACTTPLSDAHSARADRIIARPESFERVSRPTGISRCATEPTTLRTRPITYEDGRTREEREAWVASVMEEIARCRMPRVKPVEPAYRLVNTHVREEALRLFPNLFSPEKQETLSRIMEELFREQHQQLGWLCSNLDAWADVFTPKTTLLGDIEITQEIGALKWHRDGAIAVSPAYLQHFNLFAEMHKDRSRATYEENRHRFNRAPTEENALRRVYRCDILTCDAIGTFTFELMLLCAREYNSLYEDMPEEVRHGDADTQKRFLLAKKEAILSDALALGHIQRSRYTGACRLYRFLDLEEAPPFTELTALEETIETEGIGTSSDIVGEERCRSIFHTKTHTFMCLLCSHHCDMGSLMRSRQRWATRPNDASEFETKYREAFQASARALITSIAQLYCNNDLSEAKRRIAKCLFVEHISEKTSPERIMSRYENFYVLTHES